jgi:hypothetical protein
MQGIALLALLPAIAFVAPPSTFHHPVALVLLVALAACAYCGEVTLKTSVPARFDATLALALVALDLSGPIAAVIVFCTWDLMSRVVVREYPIFTAGLVSNLASYGWGAIAAAAVLTATRGGLVAAGLTMALVQFAVGRLIRGTLYQGFRPGPLIRAEFLDLVPAVLAMVLLASLTAMLVPSVGIAAIIALAPVVLIPSEVLPAVARHKSAKDLDIAAATALYAAALADVLRMRRDRRRIAIAAAHFMHTRNFGPHTRTADLYEIGAVAMYVGEHYDGSGKPAGLHGGLIPIESRVVAVASDWARLTAAGTPQLPHAEALLALELTAARRLDPRVVAAAGEVVHAELPWASDGAFQPVLHRLPLPRRVRRAALPHVLVGYGHLIA